MIQKTTRKALRKFHDEQVTQVLTDFIDLGRIPSIREHPSKTVEKTDYIDCEVFADLLQKVYENPDPGYRMDQDKIMTIPLFSSIEFDKALKRMKKRRSPDMTGIVVELIQHAGDACHEKLLNMYNGIISTGLIPPDWHSTAFSMLPKSGNLEDASNWRPIAILPVLYKIFARLLYHRIHPILEKKAIGRSIWLSKRSKNR